MRFVKPLVLASLAGLLMLGQGLAQVSNNRGGTEQAKLDAAIVAAFAVTHDGWSSDEVILQDQLNRAFVDAVAGRLSADQDAAVATDQQIADWNWRLLTLRKAGKLNIDTSRRGKTDVKPVVHLAEMAMRTVMDKHQISSDRIMTHPALRREFDRLVRQFDAEVDLYRVRKAAFQLRKTRRLRPELISRIADWGKTVSTHPLKQLRDDIELVPEQPGVYLFQDDSGYLYIGESENLRDRLQQHLDQSHNLALARHLQGDADNVVIETHAFDPESRARLVRVRRAYESSLIASRKPKFNIQP